MIFYKIVLLHFFSFFQGMQTRERAHFARSVFPFIKKKKLLYRQELAYTQEHTYIKFNNLYINYQECARTNTHNLQVCCKLKLKGK